MEVLGIGPMELILILIVALMVFGPDKLPQIGAKLGRGMREMRKATRAISDEINSTRASIEGPARELAEPFKDVADAAKVAGTVAAAAKNPGQTLRDSVMRELNAPPRSESATGETAAEENTIAPPRLTEQGEAGAAANAPAVTVEPPSELAEPEAPVDSLALPEAPSAQEAAPPEPLAQLPAPGDSMAAPMEAAAPAESEPTQVDDDRQAGDTTDPITPTAPEQ